MLKHFDIQCAALGPLQTNCYILALPKHVLVVDPSAEGKMLSEYIKEKQPNKKVDIYLTHGHMDHIGGVPELCDAFPESRIFASSKDDKLFFDPAINLSSQMGNPFTLEKYKDRMNYIEDLKKLTFDDFDFDVLNLPGHTPGGTGLYNKDEKVVFSGDTLFQGSVGRTDFPYGSYKDLMKSIAEKLMKLPDDTKVLSGHGYVTTIGEEKNTNPFIIQAMMAE